MKTRKLIALFVSVLMIMGLALAITPVTVAHAAIPDVTTTDDGLTGGTLRQAIIAANAQGGHDTIILPPGTYTLSITGPGEDLAATGDLDVTEGLTIIGAGRQNTTIDGGATNPLTDDRVFHIIGAITVNITGVTITNGSSIDGGGGVYNEGTLTLNGVAVTDNSTEDEYGAPGDAGDGGGIYNQGTLTLNNCTVSGNKTGSGSYLFLDAFNGGDGGGIYNTETLTCNDSTISGNGTGGGGAGDTTGGDGGDGGGVYSSGILSLDNCAVSGNNTGWGGVGVGVDATGGPGGDGGGIYNNAGTATLTNSSVDGNATGGGGYGELRGRGGDGGDGGGIYNNAGTATLTNSTVSGNSTGVGGNGSFGGHGGDGGGIWTASTLGLNNCTIANNMTGIYGSGLGWPPSTGGTGGGIYYQELDDSVHFKNTIIADNTVEIGGQGPDCYGPLTSHGCNLVEDTTNCPFSDPDSDITGVDPLLGSLRDNGGPTQTHALLSGSPAIDGVDDCACTTVGGDPVTTDQRGAPRPVDGDGEGNSYCDIGAYEKQPQLPPPAPPEPEEGDGEVVVGGQVKSIDSSGLGHATDEPSVATSPPGSIELLIALASGIAIAGGFVALRKRRAR